ncbi:MAG: radical SAM protein, partial [Gammaproteobacteria bacterium]|nr:radical SAM protein [Gammaproteobacteria bacterium]
MTKTDQHVVWRSARLPFGEWLYTPRESLNIVRLSEGAIGTWRPVQVSITLTSQCYKGCDFCYAESHPEGTSHWGFQDVLEIVASCDAHGVFGITFGGGEPLLWRDPTMAIDFYDLLAELRGCGCDLSFTTSAIPKVDWLKIPSTVVPRLSVHRHQDLPRILKEIHR